MNPTNDADRIVITPDELVKASEDRGVKQITVSRSLTGVPRISLSPGQSLRGEGPHITLRFADDTDGIRLSSDNQISHLRLETTPRNRAIFNDSSVENLGRIELRDLTTIGRIQVLIRDKVRGGHIEVNRLEIISADALGEQERPHGYGVGVIQGAFTLWNMQTDQKVNVTANWVGVSAGRLEKPVLGSGIFVSGAGPEGGRVTVQRLETGAVYSDGRIPAGTPDTISCGVFTGAGADVDVVRVKGPVVTHGANDMAMDNWGNVDRWIAEENITTYGPSGIGFVNFGSVGDLQVKAPIETFGAGARGFNVYDGTVAAAEFDRIITRADGAVGVQIARTVGRLVVHRGIETFGGTGPSLVKGVVTNLPAIALSVKPGGQIRRIKIDGGLRTNGKGITPLEQQGTVDTLQITGGFTATESGK